MREQTKNTNAAILSSKLITQKGQASDTPVQEPSSQANLLLSATFRWETGVTD